MKPSDADAVLAVQVAQVTADLSRIEALLKKAAIADATSEAIRDRFQLLMRNAARDLDRITADAAQPGRAPSLWAEMASSRKQVARISREALAFVQGILLRAHNLDDGVGEAADRMLDGLISRTGVQQTVLTAVDDREFLDHTLSIVRLRFPDTTVWGLPILAHELGHHVAQVLTYADLKLRDKHPVQIYLAKAAYLESQAGGDSTHVKAWLHELFADVYATYALGPAYPLAVLVLRATPDQYSNVTPTHPSWRRRVATMHASLEAMSAFAPDQATAMAYRLIAQKRVAPVWRMMSGDDIPVGETYNQAKRQATEMVNELSSNTPQPPSVRSIRPHRAVGEGIQRCGR